MRRNRSHTKSGPGRYHGQGAMTQLIDGVRYVKSPESRLPVAAHGGNWKGVKYLSYREEDELTLARLESSQATNEFHPDPPRRIDGEIDPYLS